MDKNRLLIASFICLFLFHSISFAQWEWQNPLPQGNSLYDVAFIDGNTGWAVGYYGTILFTENGGENWEIHPTSTKKCLNSICFIDDQKGWIVGDEGLILHTNNGGVNWIGQNSGISQNLKDCVFIDANFGWAVGDTGVILKTVNGGENWEIQNNPSNLTLYSVYFTDPLNGWIAGGSIYGGKAVILHSNDGGISWFEQNTPLYSDFNSTLYSIYFTDSTHGWAVGYHIVGYHDPHAVNVILYTSDGGTNWEWQDGTGGTLNAVYFSDSLNGWAVGGRYDHGSVIYTHDGGENWIMPDSGIFDRGLFAFSLADYNNKFAVGNSGIIVHTSDNDTNWLEQSNAVTVKPLKDVFFTDQDYGWTVGGYMTYGSGWGTITRGVILNTNDEGNTWINKIDDSLKYIDLSSIYCLTENMIWVAGESYVAKPGPNYRFGHIYFSGDGGNSWTEQYNGIDSEIYTVHFADGQNGWAVGFIYNDYNDPSGLILKTNNGGNDWNIHLTDTSGWYGDVFFVSESVGWISGSNGMILHTSNGGENWEEQTSGISEELGEIIFTDNENGWIIGSNLILHTTDGGDTWEESLSGEGWGLRDIHFSDMLNGWAVGKNIVLYTNDGGKNWIVYEDIPTNHLSSVWFTDPDNGWIVGTSGTILNIGNGSTVDLEEIPGTFSNSMTAYVYPNPFSTSTTIEYELNQPETVRIAFYNQFGKQVDVVEQRQSPGSQRVVWTPENLADGVYYFRLKAGEQVTSGKVVLMK